MSNNSYANNSAEYGPNIASIPFKVVEQGTINDQIYLNDIPSGLQYESSIKLMLVDREGQVMNLENEAVAKIRTSSTLSRISGFDSAKFTRGMTEINGVTFAHYPGANDTLFNVTLTNSDTIIKNMPIYVSFRYCQPGEIISENQCSRCSFRTYSFGWNSTQ